MTRKFTSIKAAAAAVACKGWEIKSAGRGEWSLAIKGEAIGVGSSEKVLAMVNHYYRDNSFKPKPITFTDEELDTLLGELIDGSMLRAWENGEREQYLKLFAVVNKISKAHGLQEIRHCPEQQAELFRRIA